MTMFNDKLKAKHAKQYKTRNQFTVAHYAVWWMSNKFLITVKFSIYHMTLCMCNCVYLYMSNGDFFWGEIANCDKQMIWRISLKFHLFVCQRFLSEHKILINIHADCLQLIFASELNDNFEAINLISHEWFRVNCLAHWKNEIRVQKRRLSLSFFNIFHRNTLSISTFWLNFFLRC